MGQIFDRLSRIIKTGVNQRNVDFSSVYIKSEEDELKKIIDDLNNKSEEKKESKNENSSNNQNYYNDRLNFADACKILQIDGNSTVEQIKTAYKDRIKEYHPDRVSGLGEEIQKVARQKTQQINEAYSIIKKYRNFN